MTGRRGEWTLGGLSPEVLRRQKSLSRMVSAVASPRVSIRLPVYNGGGSTCQTRSRASLRKASADFELILCDTPRTTGPRPICRRFAERDPACATSVSHATSRAVGGFTTAPSSEARGPYFKCGRLRHSWPPRFSSSLCVAELDRGISGLPCWCIAAPFVCIDETGRGKPRPTSTARPSGDTDAGGTVPHLDCASRAASCNPVFSGLVCAVAEIGPGRSCTATTSATDPRCCWESSPLRRRVTMIPNGKEGRGPPFLRRIHPGISTRGQTPIALVR